jgi:hypothetical protein
MNQHFSLLLPQQSTCCSGVLIIVAACRSGAEPSGHRAPEGSAPERRAVTKTFMSHFWYNPAGLVGVPGLLQLSLSAASRREACGTSERNRYNAK